MSFIFANKADISGTTPSTYDRHDNRDSSYRYADGSEKNNRDLHNS